MTKTKTPREIIFSHAEEFFVNAQIGIAVDHGEYKKGIHFISDLSEEEIEKVKAFIKRDLDPLYQGQYEIQVVPNIVHIGYGRGVGYTIEEEKFDDAITDISATKIRKELGLK